MAAPHSFTVSEVAQRLGVAQHRLIHLCEKGVVAPDLEDASGRGSSRVFSARNFLELAIAVRLREMMLPIAAVRAILHVLRALEGRLEREVPGFSLPDSLRAEGAPDLRVVLSDGQSIFFSLGRTGEQPKVFGGVAIEHVIGDQPVWDGKIAAARGAAKARSQSANRGGAGGFGGPERSRFARLELSVTEVARDLPLS